MNIVEVKERYEPELLKIQGVVGVSADLERNELVVFVRDRKVCEKIEKLGLPVKVRCEVVGLITAGG